MPEEKGPKIDKPRREEEKMEEQKSGSWLSQKEKPVFPSLLDESEPAEGATQNMIEPQGVSVPGGGLSHSQGFRFTIGKKIGMGFALALVFLVIIGAVAYRSINDIMQDLNVIEQANDVLEKANDLKVSLLDAQGSERDYVLTGNDNFLTTYYEAQKRHDHIFRELKERVKVNELLRLLDQMEPLIQKEFSVLQGIIDLRKAQGVEAVIEEIKADNDKKPIDELLSLMEVFRVKERQLSEERRTSRMMTENAAEFAIVFGVILAFAILLLVGILISRSITANLKKVVDGLKTSAVSGDLTQAVHIRTSDEMGDLAGSFNMIQKHFHSIVSRIVSASLKIMSASNELLASANQQESTTQEQSAQLNQIQATLTEFAATSSEVGLTAGELARLVLETSMESTEGTALIKDVNEKMRFIEVSNQSVAVKLKALDGSIEGIGKMLNVILSVADQTNLLSLNAAIEAAKAGEHGKGFSVVAQEIRRLADQTAQSSKEISSLINEIQASSSSVLMAMEKTSQDIKGGIEMVESMASRFMAISSSIQNVAAQFEIITASVQEQVTGQKEISSSVTQMADALRLTAVSAKEVGKSAYDLTTLGHQLRTAVGQFKLK